MEAKKEVAEESTHRYSIESPSSLLSYFGKDRKIYEAKRENGEIVEEDADFEPDNDQTLEKYMDEYEQELVDDYKSEVPFIPNTNF